MKIPAFQLWEKESKSYIHFLYSSGIIRDGWLAVKVENILKHMYHSYTFDCHGLNGLAFQMHKNYDKCITANYNSDDRNIDWFESLVG